ncbi:MAG: hypothetical protein JWQ38_296 [Flavipsychrobacter sp.]|nr:hypothetical protein [Flavipsychrobacter sp.]
MKKVFITLLCLSVSAAAVKAQDKKATVTTSAAAAAPAQALPQSAPTTPPVDPNAGKFKFDEETHDFGTVPEGPLAEYDFEFKNTGKSPIIISDAHGSCGCTVPTWPHEPILPKHSAKIHVAYTTNGRQGMINKDVIITSNAQQNTMRLHITGNVTPKPADPTPAVAPAPAAAPAGH